MAENEHLFEREEIARRKFLRKLWRWVGVVALAEFVLVMFTFCSSNRPLHTNSSVKEHFKTGQVDLFEKNSVTDLPMGKFYHSRFEDSGFLAFSGKSINLE